MNFYNPYMYSIPTTASSSSGILSKLTFSSFINGTSKTLNLINQAIPVFKQISPMFKNMKTMFKVMNEFKKVDTPKKEIKNETKKTTKNQIIEEKNIQTNYNNPTFFQ